MSAESPKDNPWVSEEAELTLGEVRRKLQDDTFYELEQFTQAYGLGMQHPGVQELLPPQDPDRIDQLSQEAEAQLKAMIEQHGVKAALGVDQAALDTSIRRMAVFHSMAHDLTTMYRGSLVGYYAREQYKFFCLVVVEEDTIGRGRQYTLEVAIGSGHGGLEERHRQGIEDRRLSNLKYGLGALARHTAGLEIRVESLPAVILNGPEAQDRQELLGKLGYDGLTYIGELTPQRNPR